MCDSSELSHGAHRLFTSHLCTHLASHGYIVAAPDHLGNTYLDLLNYKEQIQKGTPLNTADLAREIIVNPPPDIQNLINLLLLIFIR